eukprot:6731180-Ditylum_brightwellii.AAC.1
MERLRRGADSFTRPSQATHHKQNRQLNLFALCSWNNPCPALNGKASFCNFYGDEGGSCSQCAELDECHLL